MAGLPKGFGIADDEVEHVAPSSSRIPRTYLSKKDGKKHVPDSSQKRKQIFLGPSDKFEDASSKRQ